MDPRSATAVPSIETALCDSDADRVALELTNPTAEAVRVHVVDGIDGTVLQTQVRAGGKQRVPVDLGQASGRYDLTVTVPGHAGFVRVLAGRVGKGEPAGSDAPSGRR